MSRDTSTEVACMCDNQNHEATCIGLLPPLLHWGIILPLVYWWDITTGVLELILSNSFEVTK